MAEIKQTEGFPYYFSNPEEVSQHCLLFLSPFKLNQEQIPWRVHEKAPDPSLVDPVWSDKEHDWVDFSAETLPQQMSVIKAETQEMKKTMSDYQETVAASTKESTKMMQAIDEMNQTNSELKESNAQIFAMMTQMMAMNGAMPKAPTAPTTSSDEKKED